MSLWGGVECALPNLSHPHPPCLGHRGTHALSPSMRTPWPCVRGQLWAPPAVPPNKPPSPQWELHTPVPSRAFCSRSPTQALQGLRRRVTLTPLWGPSAPRQAREAEMFNLSDNATRCCLHARGCRTEAANHEYRKPVCGSSVRIKEAVRVTRAKWQHQDRKPGSYAGARGRKVCPRLCQAPGPLLSSSSSHSLHTLPSTAPKP